MVANRTLAWSCVIAWNSSWSARFCSERRWKTLSHGSFRLRPARMIRRYLPNTVITATVDCGTLLNQENVNMSATTKIRNTTAAVTGHLPWTS